MWTPMGDVKRGGEESAPKPEDGCSEKCFAVWKKMFLQNELFSACLTLAFQVSASDLFTRPW